jgi:hypothetical protein
VSLELNQALIKARQSESNRLFLLCSVDVALRLRNALPLRRIRFERTGGVRPAMRDLRGICRRHCRRAGAPFIMSATHTHQTCSPDQPDIMGAMRGKSSKNDSQLDYVAIMSGVVIDPNQHHEQDEKVSGPNRPLHARCFADGADSGLVAAPRANHGAGAGDPRPQSHGLPQTPFPLPTIIRSLSKPCRYQTRLMNASGTPWPKAQ